MQTDKSKKRRNGTKSGWFSTVFLIFIILLGVSFLLYPTVADYVNSLGYYRVIDDYRQKVAELDDGTYREMLEAAYAYNAELAARTSYIGLLNEEQWKKYESLLNLMGTGLMGYIEIPKSGIYLPIYHGTAEEVLQSGVGHFEGSSLPVGGERVHTLLSGHTGLPSSKLFTDIRSLTLGDTFMVHVLNETLIYEVENITTVLPEELEKLQIVPELDICTLFTCTPYGINTHRLVIRAHRVEALSSPGDGGNQNVIPGPQTPTRVDPPRIPLMIPLVLGGAAVLIILLICLRKRKNKR